jgi:hypothetical protein
MKAANILVTDDGTVKIGMREARLFSLLQTRLRTQPISA